MTKEVTPLIIKAGQSVNLMLMMLTADAAVAICWPSDDITLTLPSGGQLMGWTKHYGDGTKVSCIIGSCMAVLPENDGALSYRPFTLGEQKTYPLHPDADIVIFDHPGITVPQLAAWTWDNYTPSRLSD